MPSSTHSIFSSAGVEDVGIADNVSLSITGSMTPLIWHRPSAIGRIHTYHSKFLAAGNQRSYRFFTNAGNQLVYEYSDDGTVVRTAVSAAITSWAIDKWFFLGAKLVSSVPEVQFYLNGFPFGAPVAIAGPGTIFDSTAAYRVGNFDGGVAADNFRGHLDAHKLYADERTDEEVRIEYLNPPVAGDDLAVGSPFDDDLIDVTANNNDLVNNGTSFVEFEVHGFPLSEEVAERFALSLGQPPFHALSLVSISAAGVDSVPPTITIIDPLPVGTRINRFKPITFRVEDNISIAQVLVVVSLDANVPDELVYDGTNFGPFYDKLSSVTALGSTNGFLFVVAREQGWIAQPTFRAFAVDGGGNLLP